MGLSEDFKKIISYYSEDILANSRAKHYFYDMGIAINYPMTLWNLFGSILDQHGADIVSTYKSGDRLALGNLLEEIEDKYLRVSGYDESFITAVIDALAFSLDAQFSASPSDNQADDDSESFNDTTNRFDSMAKMLEQFVENFANAKVVTEKVITGGHDIIGNVQNILEQIEHSDQIQKQVPGFAEKKQHIEDLLNKLSNLMDVKIGIKRFYESHSGPRKINNNTTLLRIDSDKEFVTYNYLVDDMRQMPDKATKERDVSSYIRFAATKQESFFYKIAGAGLGLQHHYTDSITKSSFVLVFTNDELSDLLQQPLNDIQKLEYRVQQENATVPKFLDNITMLENVIIENDYVVYISRIDSYSDFKKRRANDFKQIIANNIVNAADKSFFNLVARLGKGLRYHYYSWPTGFFMRKTSENPETFDIFFPNDELTRILKT